MHRICLLIGLFFSSFGICASICPDNQCIAVVDAGNSGSRVHIYSYKLNSSTHAPVEIKNVFSKKIDARLASVPLNQAAINQYLTLLFSETPDLSIPVYFYATSGMRMLNFSSQQAYYAKVTHWFSMQSQWQLADAKTLKGQEESLYGWLAVNYELGRFNLSSAPLVSVVDTGSASVQIAVPLTNAQDNKSDDYIEMNVYGRPISLFTHDFLGLGQDEIRSQYLDNEDCFPIHYPLPNGSSAAGDFQRCKNRIKPLINEIHQVDSKVKSVIQNNKEQTWYIIGGISAMLQQRPFAFENNEFTTQLLAEKANQYVCQMDWSILGTLYPKNKDIFVNCLNASYFYSLFVEGFYINSTQPIHYISNKISTNDWTLGVVLHQKGAVLLK